MTDSMDDYMTLEEAAALRGTCVETIRRRVREGTLRAERHRGRVTVRRRDVVALVVGHERRGSAR